MKKIIIIAMISLAILFNFIIAREVHPSFEQETTTEQKEELMEQAKEIVAQPVEAVEPEPEEQYIYYNIPLSKYQQQYTQDLCKKYDLSYELVLAIMYKESTFNSNAVSYTGSSQGVMQINKNTSPWIAKQLGVTEYDMFNFGHNVQFGIWNLAYHRSYWQKQNFSDEEVFDLMLSSYHYGIAGCKQKGIAKDYVDKVYQYKSKLENGTIGVIDD